MKATTFAKDKKRKFDEKLQQKLVDMYSKHPWPGGRDADEEMGWRLKVLGVKPENYQDKRVLDLGCGTGEYSLWYAAHGSTEVVGIDLSEGSLEKAQALAETQKMKNVIFQKKNILKLDFPDNSFDFVYSKGVLHHTINPYKGFKHMCHVVRPGGTLIISLYSVYGCWKLRIQRKICRFLGANDFEKSARIGKSLFPLTLRAFNKRYHGLNPEELVYDTFAAPHASYHSAQEVLGWFDSNGIKYTGAFPPLEIKDYIYAFSLPEYQQFRSTFAGFPAVRMAGDFLSKLSRLMHRQKHDNNQHVRFKRPSYFSMIICQMIWMIFGTRFYCFTIAGQKKE